MERAARVRTSGEIPIFRREDRWSACKKDRWHLPPRGFTIIELMISMAIMVILAAMAGLLISSYRERAQVARAKADIHTLQNEIESFLIDKSRLPVDLSEVNWDTYLDPWGHPFFTTKGEDKGTGLGLAVISSIVHRHNGKIQLTSVIGQGSRFTVSFPAAADPPSGSPAA